MVLNDFCGDVANDLACIEKISDSVRNGAAVSEIRQVEHFLRVTGIDAGEHQVPLSSRRYSVISSLAFELPEGRCFYCDPKLLRSSHDLSKARFDSITSVRRETKLYETGIALLEAGAEPELVLVDGPLAFSNWWKEAGRDVDRALLIGAVNAFLDACERRGIPVVGIVKRPSARYLMYHLELNGDTSLPDSYVLHHVLATGERTEVFSPRAALRKVIRSSPFMDLIRHPVYCLYARFSRQWDVPPIRLDFPAFSLGCLDDVVEHCYATSYIEGIPFAIVKADEAVRVSKGFVSDIYLEAVSRVGRESGQVGSLAPMWGERSWLETN